MKRAALALVTRVRQSAWAMLAVRSAASVALVVALALVGSLPLARARVLSAPVAPALAEAHASAAPVASATPPTAAPAEPVREPGKATAASAVALNTATTEQLLTLPGVGPKRAEAILALRTRLGGRFRRVEDLLRVKGIGPASLRRLKPLVVLDATEPAPPQP